MIMKSETVQLFFTICNHHKYHWTYSIWLLSLFKILSGTFCRVWCCVVKDGVMVMSGTHRYRKKYVTTLLY